MLNFLFNGFTLLTNELVLVSFLKATEARGTAALAIFPSLNGFVLLIKKLSALDLRASARQPIMRRNPSTSLCNDLNLRLHSLIFSRRKNVEWLERYFIIQNYLKLLSFNEKYNYFI